MPKLCCRYGFYVWRVTINISNVQRKMNFFIFYKWQNLSQKFSLCWLADGGRGWGTTVFKCAYLWCFSTAKLHSFFGIIFHSFKVYSVMEQLLSFPSSFIKWGLDAEDTSQAMGLARPLVSRWYKGRVHDGLSDLVLTVPRLDILLYASLTWTAIASKVLGEQGHLPWWLTPKFGLISQTWSYVEVCDPHLVT